MSFQELSLQDALLRAVAQEGYTQPTPIQAQAIPPVLAGRDVLGCAQTGTGKTAAFALPILQRLMPKAAPAGSPHAAGPRPIRCLVLAPTRELAAQIGESFRVYGQYTDLKATVIFGGVGQDAQVQQLRRGVDTLVATPGRLIDLLQQKLVRFDKLEVLVLDEADRMLDMGFIRDVQRILKVLPRERQTLFFSATMPPAVQQLSREMLKDPVRIEVTPIATTAEKVEQRLYFVEKDNKRSLLEHLLKQGDITRTLVFTRTKHGADRVAKHLARANIVAEVIHGNKSQNARVRALAAFKDGKSRVLVATDIAARGIDVDGVSHVINFDLPNEPESYVHRIGRTGRAAASGVAISFCDREERAYLKDIERLIRMVIPVIKDHPFVGATIVNPVDPEERAQDARHANMRGGRQHHSARRPGGGGASSHGGGNRSRGNGGGGGGGRPAPAAGARSGSSAPAASGAQGGAAGTPPSRSYPKWF